MLENCIDIVMGCVCSKQLGGKRREDISRFASQTFCKSCLLNYLPLHIYPYWRTSVCIVTHFFVFILHGKIFDFNCFGPKLLGLQLARLRSKFCMNCSSNSLLVSATIILWPKLDSKLNIFSTTWILLHLNCYCIFVL